MRAWKMMARVAHNGSKSHGQRDVCQRVRDKQAQDIATPCREHALGALFLSHIR